MRERRARMRIPLQSAVTLRRAGTEECWPGRLANISCEGILVRSQEPFAPGQVVHFEKVPAVEGTPSPLKGSFRVRRAEGAVPPFDVAGVLLDREAETTGVPTD